MAKPPKAPKKGSKAADAASQTAKRSSKSSARGLRLLERRKHPRFLLSREQFREVKTGRIFPVYDLSMNGLSIKVDEKFWQPGSLVPGILNLHPDSIELTPRFVDYYGDRAALKLEVASVYARGVLLRALSPKRLGASLQLVREKLPLADFWYHGVCNTDLLIKLAQDGALVKVEVFFSNFYWCWSAQHDLSATGVCQSIGKEEREDLLLGEEPIKLESISLSIDSALDEEKAEWARAIVEAAPVDPKLRSLILSKF